MGLFDSKLDEARLEIADLKEKLRIERKLINSMKEENAKLEDYREKATAQLKKMLDLMENGDAQRHQGLMGALARIEAALCRYLDGLTASIKKDWHGEPDGVTNTVTIKHADGTVSTREYRTDFLYSEKAAPAFKVGDRVVLQDPSQLAGVVEWSNGRTCRVKFDDQDALMPPVWFPCASFKREEARPFQIGDRVRAPKFLKPEGEITKTHGDGFIVEFPQVTYYFEAEHLELIKGEA